MTANVAPEWIRMNWREREREEGIIKEAIGKECNGMLCLFCPLPPSFFAAVLQTCYELYSRHSHPLGCSQLAHSHGCTFFGGGDGIPLNGSEGPKLLSRLRTTFMHSHYFHPLLVAFGGEEVLKNISHLCNTCIYKAATVAHIY